MKTLLAALVASAVSFGAYAQSSAASAPMSSKPAATDSSSSTHKSSKSHKTSKTHAAKKSSKKASAPAA